MDPELNRRAKEIFLEVCDLPAGARRSALEEACGTDRGLREAVDALLKADQNSRLITGRPLSRVLSAEPEGDDTETLVVETHHRRPSRWRRWLDIRRLVWIGLTATALAIGLWLRLGFRDYLLRAKAAELQTVLEISTRHLCSWIEDNLARVEVWAADPRLVDLVEGLAELDPSIPEELDRLRQSPLQEQIVRLLRPFANHQYSRGWDVLDRDHYIISSDYILVRGHRVEPGWAEQVEWRNLGNPLFVTPVTSGSAIEGFSDSNPNRLVVFSISIVGSSGKKVANLNFNIKGYRFSELLAAGNYGETGETIAFSDTGMLISESRYPEPLKRLGWITEEDRFQASLRVSLRDPGEDLLAAMTPSEALEDWPWIEPVAQALALRAELGADPRSGIIATPYRNYLGRWAIGAWQWIPRYGMPFGVITEMEVEEALRPLRILDTSVAVFVGLTLGVLGIGAFVDRKLRSSEQPTQGFTGKYRLIRKVGEGGLAEVFLAQHALMKRPSAIKILRSEVHHGDAVKRFEREVQLASQLTHPNTIRIYDYGFTGDGRFYYSMEFLDGLNLAEVVEENGGPLPTGRVVSILLQTCRSLHEAHQLGMVHRDIKPQNIILCEQGGQYDVVKVLDFGLVKQLDSEETANLTAPHQLSGTLLYLAPERIQAPQSVDARTDIYSVGAVGYFLLAGDSPYPHQTDLDVLFRVLNETPSPLSSLPGGSVPGELEELIGACLAKEMDDRPDDLEVIEVLERLEREYPWTEKDAMGCWLGQRGGPGSEHS